MTLKDNFGCSMENRQRQERVWETKWYKEAGEVQVEALPDRPLKDLGV